VTPAATGTKQVLRTADFDGDGRADLAVRTYRGESADTVEVYMGDKGGKLVTAKPQAAFSTAEFTS